ncbi:YlbL family protein [Rhodococcus aetherivorans]|uniref:YlbL family protein n=1 Tax=Rhodococcus aetherivorans TaxID=191292 RepID=UPI00294A6D6A|nr:PDZ domain-containing protein [Rhodococcus aetherivorans]MDV6294850.1 PDZ domain-containing protein [Rhodococcus aetherivorans]
MNRRLVTILAALFPALLLVTVALNVKVPYVALGPGPTFDTLGEIDGKAVVAIEGADTDPTSGELVMTTVGVSDRLTVAQALSAWLGSRYGIAPREQIYPPTATREQVKEADAAQFEQSERSAELAALHHLDLPVVLRVARVGESGPSAGVLREGDRLVTVAGDPVTTAGSVQRAVAAVAPGTPVDVVLVRDGVEQTASVTVGARPDDPDKGFLGISPEEVPDVPFDVTFNLADVGGPSAGLIFSLAVVDKLSPGELSGGEVVAGTGTIDSDGVVGPIGGITHKLVGAAEDGATVFLVPADNCAEAQSDAPDGMRLVKVETLEGAIDALGSLAAGGDAPTCG